MDGGDGNPDHGTPDPVADMHGRPTQNSVSSTDPTITNSSTLHKSPTSKPDKPTPSLPTDFQPFQMTFMDPSQIQFLPTPNGNIPIIFQPTDSDQDTNTGFSGLVSSSSGNGLSSSNLVGNESELSISKNDEQLQNQQIPFLPNLFFPNASTNFIPFQTIVPPTTESSTSSSSSSSSTQPTPQDHSEFDSSQNPSLFGLPEQTYQMMVNMAIQAMRNQPNFDPTTLIPFPSLPLPTPTATPRTSQPPTPSTDNTPNTVAFISPEAFQGLQQQHGLSFPSVLGVGFMGVPKWQLDEMTRLLDPSGGNVNLNVNLNLNVNVNVNVNTQEPRKLEEIADEEGTRGKQDFETELDHVSGEDDTEIDTLNQNQPQEMDAFNPTTETNISTTVKMPNSRSKRPLEGAETPIPAKKPKPTPPPPPPQPRAQKITENTFTFTSEKFNTAKEIISGIIPYEDLFSTEDVYADVLSKCSQTESHHDYKHLYTYLSGLFNPTSRTQSLSPRQKSLLSYILTNLGHKLSHVTIPSPTPRQRRPGIVEYVREKLVTTAMLIKEGRPPRFVVVDEDGKKKIRPPLGMNPFCIPPNKQDVFVKWRKEGGK